MTFNRHLSVSLPPPPHVCTHSNSKKFANLPQTYTHSFTLSLSLPKKTNLNLDQIAAESRKKFANLPPRSNRFGQNWPNRFRTRRRRRDKVRATLTLTKNSRIHAAHRLTQTPAKRAKCTEFAKSYFFPLPPLRAVPSANFHCLRPRAVFFSKQRTH